MISRILLCLSTLKSKKQDKEGHKRKKMYVKRRIENAPKFLFYFLVREKNSNFLLKIKPQPASGEICRQILVITWRILVISWGFMDQYILPHSPVWPRELSSPHLQKKNI